MAGRAMMIPMMLGIFVMGGALGLTYVQGEAETHEMATVIGPASGTTNALTHPHTPVQHMAPPSLDASAKDTSLIASLVSMFQPASAEEEVAPEETLQPIATKTVCSKKKGFKSCKIVPVEE